MAGELTDNRRRIPAQPLGASQRLAVIGHRNIPRPAGAEIVAEMDGGIGSNILGWMLRLPGGNLVYQDVAGYIKMLNPHKAESALKYAESVVAAPRTIAREEIANKALASHVRNWRGDISQQEAAALIGIPVRTLNNIEAGHGFRYPRLLRIALDHTSCKAGK